MSASGVAFRQLEYFFNDVEGGSIAVYEWGGNTRPNLGRLAPHHTEIPPTYRDPFFPRPCQKVTEKQTQYSLLQQLPRKTFDR